MRNKSTMSLGNFIMDSILTGEIVWLVFEITLMIPLKDMSLKGSVWMLMILMLVSTTVGILLTFKKRRTRVSIFVNAVSGAILYFLMAYWSTFRKELTIGLLIVGALVVAYASLVLVNYFRNRPVRVSFGACLRACLLSSRTIATIGVFVIVILLCGGNILGFPTIESTEEAVIQEDNVYPSLRGLVEDNIDTLRLMNEESWVEMDADQRADLLKVLADMETAYHGIDPVRICIEPLAENLLGCYVHSTRTVKINLGYLKEEDMETMVKTVLHECYHAYQFELVEIYLAADPEYKDTRIFSEAESYLDEFNNYIKAEEDPEGYRMQDCEWESNFHAKFQLRDYQYYIADVLEGGSAD